MPYSERVCPYCGYVTCSPSLEDEFGAEIACPECRDYEAKDREAKRESDAYAKAMDESLARMDHIFGPGWLEEVLRG